MGNKLLFVRFSPNLDRCENIKLYFQYDRDLNDQIRALGFRFSREQNNFSREGFWISRLERWKELCKIIDKLDKNWHILMDCESQSVGPSPFDEYDAQRSYKTFYPMEGKIKTENRMADLLMRYAGVDVLIRMGISLSWREQCKQDKETNKLAETKQIKNVKQTKSNPPEIESSIWKRFSKIEMDP